MKTSYRRQTTLFPAPRTTHGGELFLGKRKTARPIATKTPMHLVMKAPQAKGEWSLLHPRNAPRVRTLLKKHSERHHIQVYEWANVGNHLHLLVRAKTRDGLRNFLRALAGAIAMAVTGAKKHKALKQRFWGLTTFSRIVQWGKDYLGVRNYVWKNSSTTSNTHTPAEWIRDDQKSYSMRYENAVNPRRGGD